MEFVRLLRDETYFCDEHAPLFATKTLGVPYLPSGESLPSDGYGEKMTMLFQLNLGEISPVLGLPDSGMVQIFVSGDVCESGMYDDNHVVVRFLDSVDYDEEAPVGGFFTDNDNPFELAESRYEEGDNGDDEGLVLGGELDLYELSADSFEWVEQYPEYSVPLLRITAAETLGGEFDLYVLVSAEELENRQITQALVLFEEL